MVLSLTLYSQMATSLMFDMRRNTSSNPEILLSCNLNGNASRGDMQPRRPSNMEDVRAFLALYVICSTFVALSW